MDALFNRLGTPGTRAVYVAALREGLDVSKKQVADFVARQAEAQIFRPAAAPKGQTAVRGPQIDWQLDLIDLKQLPSGLFKYILFAINVFSRKVFWKS